MLIVRRRNTRIDVIYAKQLEQVANKAITTNLHLRPSMTIMLESQNLPKNKREEDCHNSERKSDLKYEK